MAKAARIGVIQRTYYLITVLFWLSLALPLPLMVLLIQARGMSLFQIGTLMGAYSLTIVLLELPTGGLADAIGRKKVGLVSYFFMMLTGVVFVFSFSFPAFLLSFIFSGIGRALTSGTLDAWFVDALQEADPEIDLQPSFAQAGTLTFLALGIGTLLGSLIPRFFPNLPADGSAIITPLLMPLIFSFIPLIALILTVQFLVHETRPTSAPTSWKVGLLQVPIIIRESIDLSRRNTILLLLIASTLVSGLVLSGLETFWQPHFADLLGGSEGNTFIFGIIMGGNFLVGMLGNLMATWLSKLFKRRYGLLSAAIQALRGIFLLLLAMQASTIPAMLLFWLTYLNMGILSSPVTTLMNNEIPSDRRSSMLSLVSMIGYVGSFLGSVGLGYVAEQTSIGLAWASSGVVLALSALLFLRVDKLLKQRISVHEHEGALLETG